MSVSILMSVLSFNAGHIGEAGREKTNLNVLCVPTSHTRIKEQPKWKPPFESHAGSLYTHRKVYLYYIYLFILYKLTENVSAGKGSVLNLIK